jgi:hypothetical protein
MGQKVKHHFVYALIDFNDAIKYIGLTDNPLVRYKGHIQSKNDLNPKNKWIHEYLKSGHNLKMYVLFSSNNRSYASDIELFLIDYCIKSNFHILNKKESISNTIIKSYGYILPDFIKLISNFNLFNPLSKNNNILYHRLLKVDKDFIENIKYEKIGVSLPIGTIELLKNMADKEYMSVSNLVRKFILHGLKDEKTEKQEVK